MIKTTDCELAVYEAILNDFKAKSLAKLKGDLEGITGLWDSLESKGMGDIKATLLAVLAQDASEYEKGEQWPDDV